MTLKCILLQRLTNYNMSKWEPLSEDNSNAERVLDREAEILENQ